MPDINWGEDETVAKFSSRYDESSGNLILAEDNDSNTVLLEWDGTTWQYRGPVEMNGEDVSGVGTLTATNVVADSVSTKESPTIDVTHSAYGAVGDGATNDTTAIQSALDTAEQMDPPATVLLPAGRYLIDPDTLELPSVDGIHIDGDGTLVANGPGVMLEKADNVSRENIEVSGISFDGDGYDTVGFRAVGFTRGCAVDRVEMTDVTRGIDIGGSWSFRIHGCDLKGNGRSTGVGIAFSDDTTDDNSNGYGPTNAPDVSNTTARSFGTGIFLSVVNGFDVTGSTFELNGLNAYIRQVRGGSFSGNYIEAADTDSPEIKVGDPDGGISRYVEITGNRIHKVDGDATADLVEFGGAIGCEYRSNAGENNGSGGEYEITGDSGRVFDNTIRDNNVQETPDLFTAGQTRETSGSVGKTATYEDAVEVGTSATTIGQLERSAIVVVTGESDSDVTNNFVELVLVNSYDGATAQFARERGSPSGRTYSVSGFDLELEMSDGTYKVQTNSFGGKG